MRITLALMLVLVAIAMAQNCVSQEQGAIRGTVVDERGIPLPGALVNAAPLDGRVQATLVRHVETNQEGRFLLDRLDWGSYGVFAMKKESNYPDMGASFYSNDVFPKATLSPKSSTVEVRIDLGPKAGVLTGFVKNASNGALVNATFKLTRGAAPDKWMSTSIPPIYRVLLPSSTDVLLEVSAPGFRTWTPGHALRLDPGVEMQLDVLLEPSHDSSLLPSRFLVPEGYVGWLLLEYNIKSAEPAPMVGVSSTFQFPPNGVLNTSSQGPTPGAEDEFFYYSSDGSLREVSRDYTNGKGLIWGQYEESRNGIMSQFGFFVGSEEQYKRYQSQATHPGPVVPQ